MATTDSPPVGAILPDDLITEILIRLPVKYIFRCQSVSKAWLSLIKNPNFVKSQLRHSIESFNTNQTLIVNTLDEYEESHTSISLLSVDFRRIVARLRFPFSRGEFDYVPDCILVGSANGIVCLSVALSETPPEYKWHCSPFANRETNTYLWNPATRQSKVIPSYSICHDYRREALGFGFDPIDNDFKVVRIVAPPFSAEVYSANRNAWRKLPGPVDLPFDDAFDVCVNGFLCCTGLYGVMAFDLNKEVMNSGLKFPVTTSNARVTEFDASIALLLWRNKNSSNQIDMWKLDDEACLRGGGVEASWTIVFSVDLDLTVDSVHGYLPRGAILLMTDEGVWCLYDTNKKKATIVPVPIDMHQTFKYTESLVSVSGFKQVN